MSVGDMIGSYLTDTGKSQSELASELHFDRSFISRVISGEREWPEAHDANLAAINWKVALALKHERTGGYSSNLLNAIPNLDLHPAALKELLLKELNEAHLALEGLRMAKHIDPEQRKHEAEKVWHEITDVLEVGEILRGVMEDEFKLDSKALVLKHELQVKKGER